MKHILVIRKDLFKGNIIRESYELRKSMLLESETDNRNADIVALHSASFNKREQKSLKDGAGKARVICFSYGIESNDRLNEAVGSYDRNSSDYVGLLKEYIDDHYMEDISLEELSEYAYVSKSYLSSIFRERTGYTLSRYLENVRIEKAKRILNHTDMKVKEVAAAVGFRSLSYFSKCFREQTGISPSKYRIR